MEEKDERTVTETDEQQNTDRLIRMILDYDDRREYVD